MKRYILSTIAAAAALCACQDDWNEHYDQQADSQYGTASLYEIIAQRPELSDFRAVLDSTRLFANNRITATHYSKLLAEDQFLTVWAPVNGTFNRDSLLQLCQTAHGDSLVEVHFLKNHIARYGHSLVNGAADKGILMLNNKTNRMGAGTYGDASIREANIASRNGVLHVLDHPSTYRYNIYEALYSLPEFQHIGKFLYSYQINEFDETKSLAMGVVDGKTVYVDSVFYSWNRLLADYTYGHIDREDSTYWMFVPDVATWDELYRDAESYFHYSSTTFKQDSVHDYWSNYALLQDLVYNPHDQRSLRDSLCSTTWYRVIEGDQYHVYHNPYGEGGLWSYVADSMVCSNGSIYRLKKWPFSKQHTYHKKIDVQGEGRYFEAFEAKGKQLSLIPRFKDTLTVSGNRFLHIKPQTSYDPYYITYEIPGVLSGAYDICAVVLPHTMYNPYFTPDKNKAEFRPNKFIAEITYQGLEGKEYTVKSTDRYVYDPTTPGYYERTTDATVPYLFTNNANVQNRQCFTNDPYRVDTIHLVTMNFPACNYDQQRITTRVKIQNDINNKQTNTYNAEIYLDCLLFLPHNEE